MLRLTGLDKRYGDVVALDRCSFEVRRGQLLGLLGPNGAGKTTAMRTVFGLVTPDRGDVSWEGAAIGTEARRRFGYMPEQRGLYPRMKVLDQLVYFARLHGLDRAGAGRAAAELLEELGLSDRAGSRLEELSHGNQQRVQLAAALVHDPDLLVLDEPFGGLDPIGVEAMARRLAARAEAGTAVIFSSHQLDLVEDLCEDVVIIHRGAVVLAGSVGDLRARSERRYVDVEIAGGDLGWVDDLEGVTVVTRAARRIRLLLRGDADFAALAARARAAGTISSFSFSPPNLSEVFLEAVGR